MEEYVIKDGKKLRLGYTTGSCAAAAAKAAAWMLLTGHEKRTIDLLTPKGVSLTLDVLEIMRTPDAVSCAIRKDSGDDPDVTHEPSCLQPSNARKHPASRSTAARAWAA